MTLPTVSAPAAYQAREDVSVAAWIAVQRLTPEVAAQEPPISEELAQAAIDAEGPDDLAFFRGLVVALCLSACLWLAIAGGVWAALKTVF